MRQQAWIGEGKEVAAQEFLARAHAHVPSIDEEMAREFLTESNGDVSLALFKLRCKLGNGIQYKLLLRSLPAVLEQFLDVTLTPAKNKQMTTAEWKVWINSVQRALNNKQKGPTTTPVTLQVLRKLMAEGVLVCSLPPQQQSPDGKSLANSLGIDDSICPKAVQVGALLKARIENVLLMIAKCYDCLSGFPKRTLLYCNQVLGEMAVLKIDICAKKHFETIVSAGLEWQKRVRAITMPESSAHVTCSLAELLALAEKGAQMDFSLKEDIAFLQVKISEAKHLRDRAQRLLHLELFEKRRTTASRVHPTRTALRLFVEEVDAAHVTFPSYIKAKALLDEADQWTAKVDQAFKDQSDSQRVALPQLNSLHNQAVGMRVDLTKELKPVLKKIEAAKGWISKVMSALPSRKTRSRADVDKDAHPSLDQLEGLVETAGGMGVDVDRHVGKMSELISSAQNWVTTMRELLSTESSDAADNEETLHTLVHLLEREKSIPVEIPEARMLSAEVNGRLWSDQVAKLLGLGRYSSAHQTTDTTPESADANTDATVTTKSARPHLLRQSLAEAEKLRASVPLPKQERKKWHLRFEEQAKALMEKFDHWNTDANKALKVVDCTPLQQMMEQLETAKTLPLCLGKKLEQICDRVKRTQTWEERANQVWPQAKVTHTNI